MNRWEPRLCRIETFPLDTCVYCAVLAKLRKLQIILFCIQFLTLFAVDLEPKVDCLRLDEFTEVIISPRKRLFSPSKDLQEASFTQENHCERQNLLPSEPSHQVNGNNGAQTADSNSSHTNTSEHTGHVDSSLMSRFSVFVQSLFYGHNEQTSVESCKSLSTSDQENLRSSGYSSKVAAKLDSGVVKESEFNLCLRVQPEFTIQNIESNKTHTSESSSTIYPISQCPMSLYSLQPSAVFVDYSSLPSPVFKLLTGHLDTFPPLNGTVVKTMQMTKLMSPKERASLMHTSNSSPSGDLDMSNQSSPVQGELVSFLTIFSWEWCWQFEPFGSFFNG